MKKIVLFGGTTEGRLIAEALQETDVELHVCVATEYGETLLPEATNIIVHAGRMDEREMATFLKEISPEVCIDATHPYAVVVTENIRLACEESKVAYRRIKRESTVVREANLDGMIVVNSVKEAAAYLKDKEGNILLTTGSKELEEYTVIDNYRSRCYARVLPTEEVMKKCHELGFEGRNLIGMQGPFDEELNYCILKQINASYLVTKNSGVGSGYEEKCLAAKRAGVQLIVIRRPANIQEGSMLA